MTNMETAILEYKKNMPVEISNRSFDIIIQNESEHKNIESKSSSKIIETKTFGKNTSNQVSEYAHITSKKEVFERPYKNKELAYPKNIAENNFKQIFNYSSAQAVAFIASI